MRREISSFFTILLLANPLQGQDLLDQPVPWSGAIRSSTLGEIVARIQGWADVGSATGLRFASPIPQEWAQIRINRFVVKAEPSPTYEQVLISAFEEAKHRVVLERTGQGIQIVRVYSRSFLLSFTTVDRWRRAGQYSTEAIAGNLERNGIRTSKHFRMLLIPDGNALVVTGLREDIDKISRFLGE